ncbi:MAG: leucine-rich repeat domain-containing protein [Candidatus Hodarchaeales archaeon]|jgi:WD40 repeat protein/Leucine-rich repeat (LRR) protein
MEKITILGKIGDKQVQKNFDFDSECIEIIGGSTTLLVFPGGGTTYNTRLTAIDLSPLAKIARLKKIILRNHELEHIDLSALKYCPRLEELDLSSNKLNEIDLSLLKRCSNLIRLNLSGNKLKKIDFYSLSQCTQLESLSIGKNSFKQIDLAQLACFKQLKVLKLNGLNHQSMDLSPLSKISQLRSIDLSGSYTSKLSQIDLSPLNQCQNLEIIILRSHQLRQIDLSPLSNCKNLETVDLMFNKLQDIDLYPLTECTNLKTLLLSSNKLRNVMLTPLEKCKNLQEIRLEKNHTTLIDLTPLLNSASLTTLTLDDHVEVNIPKSALDEPLPPAIEGLREKFTCMNKVLDIPLIDFNRFQSYRAKSLQVSNTNTYLLISFDHSVAIWERKPGKLVQVFTIDRKDVISKSVFSQDEKKIITITERGSIQVWDRITGKTLYTLRGKEFDYPDVKAISFDQKYVAFNGYIWDLELKQIITRLDVRGSTVAFTSSNYIITSNGIKIQLWNLKTSECIKEFSTNDLFTYWGAGPKRGTMVTSPDNKYLVLAGESVKTNQIGVWDITEEKLLWSDQYYGDPFYQKPLVTPDNKYLITVSSANLGLLIRDLVTGEKVLPFRLPEKDQDYFSLFERQICLITISSDGKYLVVLDSNLVIFTWDFKTKKSFKSFPIEKDYPVKAATFAPDYNTFYIGISSSDYSYSLVEYDTRTRELIKKYQWTDKLGDINWDSLQISTHGDLICGHFGKEDRWFWSTKTGEILSHRSEFENREYQQIDSINGKAYLKTRTHPYLDTIEWVILTFYDFETDTFPRSIQKLVEYLYRKSPKWISPYPGSFMLNQTSSEMISSLFKERIRKLVPKIGIKEINDIKDFIFQIRAKIPVSVERIAKKTNLPMIRCEQILKDLTDDNPIAGEYLELEGVFIKAETTDKVFEEYIEGWGKSSTCRNCRSEVPNSELKCPYCDEVLLDCQICRKRINYGDQIFQCPHCFCSFHEDHLREWLKLKRKCPNCHNKIYPLIL